MNHEIRMLSDGNQNGQYSAEKELIYAPSTLYIVRHGEQLQNKQMADTAPLTETGRSQAILFGKYVVNNDLLPRFENNRKVQLRVRASGRLRTMETARLALTEMIQSAGREEIPSNMIAIEGLSDNAYIRILQAAENGSLHNFYLESNDIARSHFLMPHDTLDAYFQGEDGSYPAYKRWCTQEPLNNPTDKRVKVRTPSHLKKTFERYFTCIQNASARRNGDYDQIEIDFSHETHVGAFDTESDMGHPRRLNHVSFFRMHTDGPGQSINTDFNNAEYRNVNNSEERHTIYVHPDKTGINDN